MSDQDDFTSPEEIQAKANSNKIRRFSSAIGWQCIIFITILYATVFSNSVALTGLEIYAWIVGLSLLAYFFISIKSIRRLAMISKLENNSMILNTPTAVVIKVIGTVFSLAEMGLMFTYGFFWLVALWGVAEVLQYIASYKLSKALNLIPSDLRNAVNRQCEQNPEFETKLLDDMKDFQKKIDKIDELTSELKDIPMDMIDLEERDKIDEDLLEARDKLIIDMEDRITLAALETMSNQGIEEDSDEKDDK